MRRREFLALMGGAVAEWPLAAHGQLGERAPKIGVIMNYAEGDPEGAARFGALRDRLGALGWIDGRSAKSRHVGQPVGPI